MDKTPPRSADAFPSQAQIEAYLDAAISAAVGYACAVDDEEKVKVAFQVALQLKLLRRPEAVANLDAARLKRARWRD